MCSVSLANRGFSIGISDVTPGVELRARKDRNVNAAYDEALKLIERAKNGLLPNDPGCDQDQTLEAQILGCLSQVRERVGDICLHELSPLNAPLIMATCKSKGPPPSMK